MAIAPAVWVIAYISSKHLPLWETDKLKHPKYKGIKCFIPMVKVLKKKYKNQEHFDEVPFLFNYGFFRVPKYFITNPHFMQMMKDDFRVIYGWVYNGAHIPGDDDKIQTLSNPNRYAIATQKELIKLRQQQQHKSIFSKDDVKNLYIGKVITLKGYPFDNLDAEIVRISKSRKKAEVKLLLGNSIKKVVVSFENIFFTMYNSQYMNTEMKERSLEEMEGNSMNMDNIMKDEW